MFRLLRIIELIGAVTAFAFTSFRCLFTGPRYIAETFRVMDILARRCLVPVGLAVAPVGAVISLQGTTAMRDFGAEGLLSSMIGTSVFRLYSPMLASVMVAAQAGSSIAARIGTMKVRGQIDALAVMSVDPVRYVVVPGIIACVLMTPLLNISSTILGIASGWLFAVPVGGINQGAFAENLYAQISLMDLWVGMGKCAVYGGAVGVIAGFLGLRTEGGAAGVGRAANNTVVYTIVLILIADYVVGLVLLALGI
ncbi:MAG: ABC transporter permease [Myxococcales bacterium]|nr:ABC transporter permease [Myxococcales bacterium]